MNSNLWLLVVLIFIPLIWLSSPAWLWRRNENTKGDIFTRNGRYEGIYGFDYGYSYPPGQYSGIAPKNYRRSDERIFDEVCDRLMIHGEIDPTNIDILVKNAEVTLSGVVPNKKMKRAIEEVVDHVAGVLEIKNELKINPSEYKSDRLAA
jgi:hypothetical protein